MADSKISALTSKATPIGADYIPIVDSVGTPTTKRALLSSLPVSTAQQAAIDAVTPNWGSIGGTIGDQTDLITLLGNYALDADLTAAEADILALEALRVISTFTGTSIARTAGSMDETKVYTGGSAQTFTGFGTINTLPNGWRCRVLGTSDSNTLTINENDASDGWIMGGDIILGRGQYIDFEYNSTLARMVQVGRSPDA